jgi:hypothetical protein
VAGGTSQRTRVVPGGAALPVQGAGAVKAEEEFEAARLMPSTCGSLRRGRFVSAVSVTALALVVVLLFSGERAKQGGRVDVVGSALPGFSFARTVAPDALADTAELRAPQDLLRGAYFDAAEQGAVPGAPLVAAEPAASLDVAEPGAPQDTAEPGARRGVPVGWARRVELPGLIALEGVENRSLLLVDIVLVPKHGHVLVSAMPSAMFNKTIDPHASRWQGPGPWERLAQVCAALPVLELAVGRLVLRSEPCVPLVPNDPNLSMLSIATFALGAAAREAVRTALAAREPDAELAVRLGTGVQYATIDLLSRAAGLFRAVRRPGSGRGAEDLGEVAAWADPLGAGANPPEQLSVCMKQIRDSNAFMEDIVGHHEAQGVAHLYLGVVGPEIEREMTERLAPWIAKGFVSLVQEGSLASFIELDMQVNADFWLDSSKVLFLASCLHHAKQVDSLVGAWDIDELVSIHAPDGRDPHLGRFIVDHYRRWALSAGHPLGNDELQRAPEGADLAAAAVGLLDVVERPNGTAQPVLPLLWYCEVSLARIENHGPKSKCGWPAPVTQKPQRGVALATAFPLRNTAINHFPKGIAIAANVQLLELHQHNFNCERNVLVRDDRESLRLVRAPPDSRSAVAQKRRTLHPAPDLFCHHFGDMYVGRRKGGATYALSEFWRTLPQSLLRDEKEIENLQRAASFISCSNT